MIDLKPLKNESRKFEEPLKSIMEMAKDKMSEQDFVEFFISLRKKARETDNIKRAKP
jgi:predicted nucleotide-binding protein (sugar kinase/HSP70/actin superfamily)